MREIREDLLIRGFCSPMGTSAKGDVGGKGLRWKRYGWQRWRRVEKERGRKLERSREIYQ